MARLLAILVAVALTACESGNIDYVMMCRHRETSGSVYAARFSGLIVRNGDKLIFIDGMNRTRIVDDECFYFAPAY